MKKILGLFACLILVTATVVKAETLTNDSIIQLHKVGLADSTITAKIKASTCNFDTSVDALKTLKDAGISDEVLQAMLLVSSSVKAAPAPVGAAPAGVPPGDPNDPKAAHASGIYLYEEVGGKPKMTQMTPSRVEDMSTGSGWGMAWGGSAKTRAVLAGAHAQLQTTGAESVFYFYFTKSEASLGSMDVAATSPDDFSLGVMEAHTSHDQPVRRLEISKMSMGGYHVGLNKKDVRPFTTEKISDGVFKVTPTALKPGEYVFVQLIAGNVASAMKMFDFGIAGGK
jgi:hypothetical protein